MCIYKYMWIHTWISQTCFFQTLGLGKVQNHEVRGFLIHTILRSFTFTYSPNLAHPAMVTFYQNKTSCFCSASFARAWPASAQNWWACCVFGFGANGSRHICFPGQEPRHQKKSQNRHLCNRTASAGRLAWVALLMHLSGKMRLNQNWCSSGMSSCYVLKISNYYAISKRRIPSHSASLSCKPFCYKHMRKMLAMILAYLFSFMLLPSFAHKHQWSSNHMHQAVTEISVAAARIQRAEPIEPIESPGIKLLNQSPIGFGFANGESNKQIMFVNSRNIQGAFQEFRKLPWLKIYNWNH